MGNRTVKRVLADRLDALNRYVSYVDGQLRTRHVDASDHYTRNRLAAVRFAADFIAENRTLAEMAIANELQQRKERHGEATTATPHD